MIICLSLALRTVCYVLIVCLAKALSSAIGLYSSRLQGCQNHLKDSTELLQVFEFSHHTNKETETEGGQSRIFTYLLLPAFDMVFKINTQTTQKTIKHFSFSCYLIHPSYSLCHVTYVENAEET